MAQKLTTPSGATTLVSSQRPGRNAAGVDLPGPGATLAGKYELVRELGRGGMGVVMEARDLRLGRRVAIKMMSSGVWQEPELVARFEREARAVARLQSEHAVRLLDVDVAKPALPFMVMEYLEGRSLDGELAERGPLPWAEAVGYVLEACEAMAEAHAAGIVHRDIKPANLFVCRTPSGRRVLKVLDFGISKLTNEGERALTQTNASFGTPEYMSPEQVRAKGPIDGRSDVWSLGVVLYQLLSGTTPFRGDTVPSIFVAIATDAPAPLGPLRPDLPVGLELVLARALHKNPAERFPSALAFAEALAPFAEPPQRASSGVAFESNATQALSRPPSWPGGQTTVPRHRSARRTLLLALGLASVAMGVAGVWLWGAEPMRAGGATPGPAVSPLRPHAEAPHAQPHAGAPPAQPHADAPPWPPHADAPPGPPHAGVPASPPTIEPTPPASAAREPVANSVPPPEKTGVGPRAPAPPRGKVGEPPRPPAPVIEPIAEPAPTPSAGPARRPPPAPSAGPALPIGPDGHPTRF
ncbi:MAG TPA: protein kinase [Polyangiaceae bacterium]|nr:protein kinase [Polyangiaceae bacterium]